MAFSALSFVVPFLSYCFLYNLRYDVTSCTWYCNKTENQAYLWIDFTKLSQTLQTWSVNKTKHYLYFRCGCQDNSFVSRPFYLNMNFTIWSFQVQCQYILCLGYCVTFSQNWRKQDGTFILNKQIQSVSVSKITNPS